MNNFDCKTDRSTIDWLLDAKDPSIIYFTKLWLLDKKEDDPEVLAIRKAIPGSARAAQLLAGQREEGFWGDRDRYIDDRFRGTAWRVQLLLELGADPKLPQIQKAVQFLAEAAYNNEAGGFVSRQRKPEVVPCYTGDLLRIFFVTGNYRHPHVTAGLEWLLRNMTFHDGDNSVPEPDSGCFGRHTCIRGLVPVLRALAELPEIYRSEKTIRLLEECIEFMLIHRIYKSSHNFSRNLNPKMTQLTFPNFYYPDLLSVMLVFTALSVRDLRMQDAVDFLLRKRGKDGTWKLQRLYNERAKTDLFPVVVDTGERGMPSRWITLRAMTVLKRYFDV
ncbi:MAG: hypothetical protein JW874_14740 [Spirochaetales bacterium]|nr:hypothetical protein [Spirochaetales bacterium]